MSTQKKKTRQRNRPRNKVNRDACDLTDILNEDNEGKEICENSESLILNPIANEQDTKKNEESGENLILNSNTNGKDTKNNEVSASPVIKQASAHTPTLCENTDAIRLIQQMMRAKILKQNEENSIKKDASVKSASKMEKENVVNVKKSKSKEKIVENSVEKNAFIANLQRKMQNVMENGSNDLPSAMLDNLQKLFDQTPISDVENSDEEEEYIEYIYKPRQYFLVSLCNFCKSDLRGQTLIPCTRCKMTYYCCKEHIKSDQQHRQLCYGLRQVSESCGGHIFDRCGEFTTEQFRSYRIVSIRKVEAAINRSLSAAEQEVILFPRICSDIKCRENRFNKLMDCNRCGQAAYCKDKPAHLNKQHHLWCSSYQLFKELIIFQEKFGRLDPSLPTKVLKELPSACSNTKQILNKLSFDIHDACEYAALSQISTGPLTAWYALKLCNQLQSNDILTIHLIGAEVEFEVDVLHKWELFFLHLTPAVKELNVVFVGPELNQRSISFEQLQRTKCCRNCRKNERTVKYHFENDIYHDYSKSTTFLTPNLICFFNAGLYRSTGFHLEDTWPETILAAANLKCPVAVTSYTEYEAPLDMTRFVQECNRRINVVLPPTKNPFASDKPERNFISDEEAPLMFKNFYCFVVE